MQEILRLIEELKASDFADIVLVTAFFFILLRLIQGTRAVQMLRGILVVGLALWALLTFVPADWLPASNWLFNNAAPILLLAIPVIFQPELRRALEQLGRTGSFMRLLRRENEDPIAGIIANACQRLSQRRHGALIVLEKGTGLQEYIDTGTLIDAAPTPELLLTIFNKHTELHDGAVIIRNDRISAAGCVMPLSTSSLSDRQMGLRHRAGMGISEVSDAVVVIVSEETGQITLAHNGRMWGKQDPAQLERLLGSLLQNRGDGALEP